MKPSVSTPVSQNRVHRNRGFTLIELLTVVTIIGVLMALLVGAARFARIKAMEGRAKSDLQHLANALNEYQMKYRGFPTESDFLTTDVIKSKLPASVDLQDPWDRQYVYKPNPSGLSYTLSSEGRTPGVASDDITLGK